MRDLLREERSPGLYGPREEAALRFAEEMTLRSTAVPEAVHAALRERFTEEEMVEIAAVAGLFNYFNRFNSALGVPPTAPSPFLEGPGEPEDAGG